jgi:hypothetical protein
MQIDLTNRTIKIGGSTAPKFSVAATGVLSATDVELTGALTADDGLVGVAGSLRTKVDAGRVYFYRSNGTDWVLMSSMRGALDITNNYVILSGATDSDEANLDITEGFIRCGSISFRASGSTIGSISGYGLYLGSTKLEDTEGLYTAGGSVRTAGGDVLTSGGDVNLGSGGELTGSGNIVLSRSGGSGNITCFDISCTSLSSSGGSIYSLTKPVTSTSFAPWFIPVSGECGLIFYSGGSISGFCSYLKDSGGLFVELIKGDATYVQSHAGAVEVIAPSGVTMTFHSLRGL